MLTAMLDGYREGVLRTVEGRRQADATTSPLRSGTTAAGLVKHLALVEDGGCTTRFAGRSEPERRASAPFDDDRDREFSSAAKDEPREHAVGRYRTACERSREVAAAHALDDTAAGPLGWECSLRWVLLHLVEETARQLGHLDLLRELADGSTGEEVQAGNRSATPLSRPAALLPVRAPDGKDVHDHGAGTGGRRAAHRRSGAPDAAARRRRARRGGGDRGRAARHGPGRRCARRPAPGAHPAAGGRPDARYVRAEHPRHDQLGQAAQPRHRPAGGGALGRGGHLRRPVARGRAGGPGTRPGGVVRRARRAAAPRAARCDPGGGAGGARRPGPARRHRAGGRAGRRAGRRAQGRGARPAPAGAVRRHQQPARQGRASGGVPRGVGGRAALGEVPQRGRQRQPLHPGRPVGPAISSAGSRASATASR